MPKPPKPFPQTVYDRRSCIQLSTSLQIANVSQPGWFGVAGLRKLLFPRLPHVGQRWAAVVVGLDACLPSCRAGVGGLGLSDLDFLSCLVSVHVGLGQAGVLRDQGQGKPTGLVKTVAVSLICISMERCSQCSRRSMLISIMRLCD